MSLKVYVAEAPGEVVTIALTGGLKLGTGTYALRETIEHLRQRGSNRIVLDLEGLSQIDSSGLGELVAAQTAARSAGGCVKLAHLNRRVVDLLKLTRLFLEFEIFDDANLAIRSFSPPKPTELQLRWARFMDRVVGLGQRQHRKGNAL